MTNILLQKNNSSWLTVAICTYNRADMLKESLASLQRQSVPPDRYDLLVVDNNSTDNTQATAATFTNVFPSLRIVCESQQGLSHARNRAVAECTTEWIAFLDDDAKARPHWVQTLLDVAASNDFDAFGGPFYAWHHHGTPPFWLPPNFGTYEAKQDYGPLTGNTYIPGGNCAIRLTALRKVGNFSANMGMRGNVCAYGEETQVFNQMEKLGYKLGYVPHLQIDHCVLPHKYTLRWQLASAFARGRAGAALGAGEPLRRFPMLLLRDVKQALKALYTNVQTRGDKPPLTRVALTHARHVFWRLGVAWEKLCRKYRRSA